MCLPYLSRTNSMILNFRNEHVQCYSANEETERDGGRGPCGFEGLVFFGAQPYSLKLISVPEWATMQTLLQTLQDQIIALSENFLKNCLGLLSSS